MDVARAFADHGGAIFGFALNATRDRTLAEDCVQETFVRAWRFRERYDGERASERTWLFAIARNVLVDQLGLRARRPLPVGDPAQTTEVAASGTSGLDSHEHVLARLDLVAAVAMLSDKHREVVAAVALGDVSYEALSQRTGVPVATLRTRMFHALRALRRHLTEEDDHDARP